MSKPKVIYVADPLCGWCYGFSPVITKLEQKFTDRIQFEMLCGGLALGDRAGTIDEKFSFIKTASSSVTDYTGVEFGEEYRKNILGNSDTYVFDSIPPCVAIVIFREMLPDRTIEFVSALQKALYFDGKSLNDPQTYVGLFESFGLTEEDYLSKAELKEYKEIAHSDFQKAQAFGVTGFPALILDKDENLFLISRGYRDYQTLEKVFMGIKKSGTK
jgi:putative protein-disulfide isomerase